MVRTQHTTKDGQAKLVERCSYPLTGKNVVSRIYTDLAVLEPLGEGFALLELAPGVSLDYVRERTDAALFDRRK